MNLKIYKDINPANLIGVAALDRFKTTVSRRIKRYCKDNKAFAVVVLELSITDMMYSSQVSTFAEYLAEIIHDKINNDLDYYSIEENRFIILFGESNKNVASITISKIINDAKQKLRDYVEIHIGAAECPQNGITFDEIINSARFFIDQEKKMASSGFTTSPLYKKLGATAFYKQNKQDFLQKTASLVTRINKYDKHLSKHSALVSLGAIIFAKELDLPWIEIERIAVSALLHDIGYTAFPENIFQKPSKLTPEDWKLVKLHTVIGCEQILEPMEVFSKYIPIIINHHEFIDGSGYPRGKKGDQIPLGAQIISIVDSYQAMTADRAYRKALEFEDIVDIYIRNAGIKWEKDLITSFMGLIGDPTLRNKLASKSNLNFELAPF